MKTQEFLNKSQASFAKRHGAISICGLQRQGDVERYSATFLKDKEGPMHVENFVTISDSETLLDFLGM